MSEFSGMFQYVRASATSGERQEAFVPPPWFGPPEAELGAIVPLSAVLARSERAVVALRGATVYSTGVTFDLVAAARGLSDREANRLMHEQHVFDPDDEPSDAFLRIGVELADGTRASNLAGRQRSFEEPPDGPVLQQHGGGGGGSGNGRLSYRPAYWLWPLPPTGPMHLVVEWPALDVALTGTELDTARLLAAPRPVPLWPS